MAIPDPWRRHRQAAFLDFADDPEQPTWLRLAFLAWGFARKNGHANFKRGELAERLQKPAPRITEALNTAKARGMIGMESNTQCLIVPANLVEVSGDGSEYERCGIHDVARGVLPRRRRTPQRAEVIPFPDITDAGLVLCSQPGCTGLADLGIPLSETQFCAVHAMPVALMRKVP